jgi:hypothetical protein
MSGPRGKVQRFDFADGVKLFYRTRDPALFAESEWGWSLDPGAAWIFDSYDAGAGAAYENCASAHATRLRSEGAEHVLAVVVALDPQIEAEREQRHRDRLAQAQASVPRVPPAECYRRTAALLGERE